MLKLAFRKMFGLISLLILVSLNVSPCVSAELLPGDRQEDPIVIRSRADLEVFAQDVLNGNTYAGKYVRLDNDIYLTRNETSNGRAIKWEPIGSAAFNSHNKEKLVKTKSFDGFFDGNGNTIYCNINGFYQSNEFSKASAIFGCLGKDGVIRNLNVKGKVITNNIKVSPAVICNVNLGTIENCNLTADVKNSKGVNGISFANYGTISHCSVRGNFETRDLNCSGVASLNYGKIQNCFVDANFYNGKSGDINGENNYRMPETGGIANFNKGEILGCKVKANIVSAKINKKSGDSNGSIGGLHGVTGGIVSENEGIIKDCSFSGEINSLYSGGIAGLNYNDLELCRVSDAIIQGTLAGEFSGVNLIGLTETGRCINCQFDETVKIVIK